MRGGRGAFQRRNNAAHLKALRNLSSQKRTERRKLDAIFGENFYHWKVVERLAVVEQSYSEAGSAFRYAARRFQTTKVKHPF